MRKALLRAVGIAIMLSLGGVAANAASSLVDEGAKYKGKTEQRSICGDGSALCKVLARVSDDGEELRKLKIYWSAPCFENGTPTGFSYNDSTVFEQFLISTRGKVGVSGSYEDETPDGEATDNQVSVKAQFDKRRKNYVVSGTFRNEVRIFDVGGTTDDWLCDTGKLNWEAKS